MRRTVYPNQRVLVPTSSAFSAGAVSEERWTSLHAAVASLYNVLCPVEVCWSKGVCMLTRLTFYALP